jgi:ribose 5-phosphate isomerase A
MSMSQETLKQKAAMAALDYIEEGMVVGVGTGSTVKYFIEALASKKHDIEGAVASSVATEQALQQQGIPLLELNSVDKIDVYVDSADEVNRHRQCIKGGGAALTREKILASAAQKFICIVDQSKVVDILGKEHPLPVEVLDIARSYVSREIVRLGGSPEYREGSHTDNGHVIIDVYNMNIIDPPVTEQQINHVAGVVSNGIFALRAADLVLVANDIGITKI